MPYRRRPTLKRKRPVRRVRRRVRRTYVRRAPLYRQVTNYQPKRIFRKLSTVMYFNDTDITANTNIVNTIRTSQRTFDPTLTIQPQGWDQIVPMYRFYRVHGLAYNIQVIRCGPTANTFEQPTMQLRVYPLDNAVSLTNATAILTNRFTKVRWLKNANDPVTIKGYLRPHTVLGLTKKDYNTRTDTAASTATGTDPAKMAFLFCHVANTNATINSRFSMMCKVQMYVEFFDAIVLVDA